MHVVDEEVDFPADEQQVCAAKRRDLITRANEHGCREADASLAEMIGQHHQMLYPGLAIRGLLLLLGADVRLSS